MFIMIFTYNIELKYLGKADKTFMKAYCQYGVQHEDRLGWSFKLTKEKHGLCQTIFWFIDEDKRLPDLTGLGYGDKIAEDGIKRCYYLDILKDGVYSFPKENIQPIKTFMKRYYWPKNVEHPAGRCEQLRTNILEGKVDPKVAKSNDFISHLL